jgi:hypothetical protein
MIGDPQGGPLAKAYTEPTSCRSAQLLSKIHEKGISCSSSLYEPLVSGADTEKACRRTFIVPTLHTCQLVDEGPAGLNLQSEYTTADLSISDCLSRATVSVWPASTAHAHSRGRRKLLLKSAGLSAADHGPQDQCYEKELASHLERRASLLKRTARMNI